MNVFREGIIFVICKFLPIFGILRETRSPRELGEKIPQPITTLWQEGVPGILLLSHEPNVGSELL